MAGWSGLKDGCGSAMHDVEFIPTSKTENGYVDLPKKVCNFDASKERLRNLFDQVLSVFLKEETMGKCVPPLPALLGDGRPVDLFKLFWVVRKRGGYGLVSANGLWDFVSEECDLGVGTMAAIKVIYFKYLSRLDQWLQRVFREEGLGKNRAIAKLDLLSLELETEFRGLLSDEWHKRKRDSVVGSEFGENGKGVVNFEGAKTESHLWAGRNANEMLDNAQKIEHSGDKKISVHVDDDAVSLAKNVARIADDKACENGETINNDYGKKTHVKDENNVAAAANGKIQGVLGSLKRKRECLSLSEMLNWVNQAAKHSDDPAVGRIPESSKWKQHGTEELWVQALSAREALLIKRPVDSNAENSQLPKKLKTHPSMYEDIQSAERVRCSRRLPSLAKSHLCPCCNSSSAVHVKPVSSSKEQVEDKSEASAPIDELLVTNKTDEQSVDELHEKKVSVGPLYQAEVPHWMGVIHESESKWLGTQMWPPENWDKKCSNEMGLIGKGRPNSCDCQFPGSVKCVRFHIAENRIKLRREVGLLFYHWKFDRMGEEVSLSWTLEEEKRFKDMVRLNAVSQNKFWDNALRFFPTKTRSKLLGYYFNVFQIRRRSYQNRVVPKDIDSDDDEKEFGAIGDSFGNDAIHIAGSGLLICSQNEQCTDLEHHRSS